MPKLLQINSTVNVGSTGRIAEQIGAKAIAHGWESYIAYGRACGDSCSTIIKIGSVVGVWLHALLTRLTDKHGLFSTFATKRLIRRIEEINPDIIHLHNIHGYYINYKILFDYLHKADIPIVWTLHDCWSITGHCSHFEYVKCNKWKSECCNCPQKQSYPTSILLDRSKKNFIDKKQQFSRINNLTLVPVSAWLASVVHDSFLKNKKVSVIYNGIDLQMFEPRKNEEITKQYKGKHIVLGVASPWSDKKGWSDFLKLHTLLSKDKYQIVLIGLSAEQTKQLPRGIIGLSRTNSVIELAEWYSQADVFVNMTYEDSYPTTNLEAISCGTPVITYCTGGSPESVTPQTGIIVEQGNLDGVVKAIEELCAEDRYEMRKLCRKHALEHFDCDRNYEMYLKLYEQLLSR